MNTIRTTVTITIFMILGFLGAACSTQTPMDSTAIAAATNGNAPVNTASPASEPCPPDLMQVRYEEYKKLSTVDKARNEEIRASLQKERLDVLTPGLPVWVKEHLTAFEQSGGDFGAAYSRSIAWGTGVYKGKSFHWFGHTNSDGWLQMDMSAALDPKDIDQILGIRFGDLERVPDENRPLDVTSVTSSDTNSYITKGTLTHLGLAGSVNWTDEFCVKPKDTVCDTSAAFDKYLLPAANKALPGLTFKLDGRFPR